MEIFITGGSRMLGQYHNSHMELGRKIVLIQLKKSYQG
jgi:hypothetical protein